MFYIPESEQEILKGLEIRGTFVQKVEGYVRFFIGLSNGSIFVASAPETEESAVDSKEIVKKSESIRGLDRNFWGVKRGVRIVNPDVMEHELRVIGRRIFNSGMITLGPMDTPANREAGFDKFGEDFKEWYLSLGTLEKPNQDTTVVRGGRGYAMFGGNRIE